MAARASQGCSRRTRSIRRSATSIRASRDTGSSPRRSRRRSGISRTAIIDSEPLDHLDETLAAEADLLGCQLSGTTRAREGRADVAALELDPGLAESHDGLPRAASDTDR